MREVRKFASAKVKVYQRNTVSYKIETVLQHIGNTGVAGLEMSADGFDESSMEEEDDSGGEGSTFQDVNTRKRRRKARAETASKLVKVTEIKEDEFKVTVKLVEVEETFGNGNPMRLTKEISNKVGAVKLAKILRNGSLLIICKDAGQQAKALGIKKLNGKDVKCNITGERRVRGVITGIPVSISEEEIKDNMKRAKVSKVQRMKTNRDGIKSDSLSVLITFEGEKLPEKVYLGYMCYDVRAYVPPPLRCFKCQKFGHIAAVCKGKKRCSRCGGEHDYGECEEGAKVKCCNCGGEHSAAYGGCEASKKAQEVQKVKVVQGISYAEAVKKVSEEAQIVAQKRQETRNERPVQQQAVAQMRQEARKCEACDKVKEETMIVNKNDFVMFMAEVINLAIQARSRTERIKIVVQTAVKYLDVKGLQWETVQTTLEDRKENDDSQQSLPCFGPY